MAKTKTEERVRTKQEWRARRDGLQALVAEWDLYPAQIKRFKRYYNSLVKRQQEASANS
jgi:hypothetical protein